MNRMLHHRQLSPFAPNVKFLISTAYHCFHHHFALAKAYFLPHQSAFELPLRFPPQFACELV